MSAWCGSAGLRRDCDRGGREREADEEVGELSAPTLCNAWKLAYSVVGGMCGVLTRLEWGEAKGEEPPAAAPPPIGDRAREAARDGAGDCSGVTCFGVGLAESSGTSRISGSKLPGGIELVRPREAPPLRVDGSASAGERGGAPRQSGCCRTTAEMTFRSQAAMTSAASRRDQRCVSESSEAASPLKSAGLRACCRI